MGVWEPITTQIWETIVTPCDCCGQVVAKRLWKVEIDGQEHRFCSPQCEELYRSYVMRGHRPSTAGTTGASSAPAETVTPVATSS